MSKVLLSMQKKKKSKYKEDRLFIFRCFLVTFTSEGEGGDVFTPFLSVCPCTGYLKKLWMDSDEILWTGWLFDKDELIRLWWRSGSGSGDEFFTWFFTIERWGQKLYVAWYFKKLWTDYAKPRWIRCVSDKNKPIRFRFRCRSRSGLSVGYKT